MKKRVIIVLILLMAVLGGIWWFKIRPTRSTSETSEFYGNVDIREVNLGFRVGGKIGAVLREEGDTVVVGEELARLDDAPYRREVEEARAQVQAMGARLTLLERGYRTQELAQARAVVREREATLENAVRTAARQSELFASRAVPKQDYEDAQAREREAEARLNSAREQLALLESGFRPEEIAQAKADLARAEAGLASSELRLGDTVLKAPTDGVVLTRVHEPGAIVPSGATVLTVSLKSPVWVRMWVHEPELGRIVPGMKVRVYTDSRPESPYDGQIGFISPRAEFTPKNVETAELRTSLVFRVRVVVASPDDGLRQGMPVTVRLVQAGGAPARRASR